MPKDSRDDELYSAAYVDQLKQIIDIEYAIRKEQVDPSERRKLHETRLVFEASLNAFKKMQQAGPFTDRRSRDHHFQSVFYIESVYVPVQLRLNQSMNNPCNLGLLIFIQDYDLTKGDLETFQHLLYLNMCSKYDYCMVGKGIEYFFHVNKENLTQQLDQIKNEPFLDAKDQVTVNLQLFDPSNLSKPTDQNSSSLNDFKSRSIIKTTRQILFATRSLVVRNRSIRGVKSDEVDVNVFANLISCDLAFNEIVDLNKLLKTMEWLVDLKLSHNQIEEIGTSAFQSLRRFFPI
jgi:hypothetical protein